MLLDAEGQVIRQCMGVVINASITETVIKWIHMSGGFSYTFQYLNIEFLFQCSFCFCLEL